MLTISEQSYTSLAADHDRRRPARFAAWWQQHAEVLGPRSVFDCSRLLAELAEEIAFTGLQQDEQHFLFCAARVRMPDMGEREYLATLDVIVGDGTDRDKLLAFDAIARGPARA